MAKTKQSKTNKWRHFWIVGAIVVVGVLLRLYQIAAPLADYHSWRQADTAAVSRNFARDGIDMLHPRYDDLSNVQSGQENPFGYRMVEFPLYNAAIALLYNTAPTGAPIEVYGRIVSVIAWATIAVMMYFLLLWEVGIVAAITATLVFTTMPFMVFFTRVVLPETTALAFAFGSLFTLYVARDKNRFAYATYVLVSSALFAGSLLIKPTTLFFGLPLLYLFIRKHRIAFLKKPSFYLYFLLAAIPLILWRFWITQYPEGIPVSSWLFTSVNTSEGVQSVFFRPSFFRWILFERINNIILGGYLTAFFILGTIAKPKKWFMHYLLTSSILYIFTFQGGNLQHEYYQTLILPTLCMFIGIGVSFLFVHKQIIIPAFTAVLTIAIWGMSFLFSYYTVKNYYVYSEDIPHIANIVKTLTSPTDLIVTDTLGDTTLLYAMDRRGAPAVYKDLTELKGQGYTYFVTQKKDVIEEIKKTKVHKLVFENDKFALFLL